MEDVLFLLVRLAVGAVVAAICNTHQGFIRVIKKEQLSLQDSNMHNLRKVYTFKKHYLKAGAAPGCFFFLGGGGNCQNVSLLLREPYNFPPALEN